MSFSLALDYDVHDGCPSASVFVEQVTARTAKARFANDGPKISVHVVRDGGKSRGELIFADGGTRRTLDGSSCADVVSGLAFALALALDARETPPDPEPAAPSPIAVPVTEDTRPAVATSAPTTGRTPRVAIGFAGGVARDGVLTAIVGPWATWRVATWTIRVAALTGEGSIERATFRRMVASADGCYGTWLSGCVGVEGGVLRASGVGVDEAVSVNRAWFAMTGTLRAEVRPIEALVLEARGGIAVPLVRDTFALHPGTTLHRTAAVSPFIGIGLAVTIP